MWTHVACVTNEIRCQVDRSKLTMDKVEFLFKCVEEGKLSKEQASAILGKSQPGQAKSTDKGAASTTGALKRPLERKIYYTMIFCIYLRDHLTTSTQCTGYKRQ